MDWTLRLDQFFLEQWLCERNARGGWRAWAYAVDREAAAEWIRAWGVAEVIAELQGEFAWLEARLRLAGINALLGDGALAAPSLGLERLERALQQGAHVLSHGEGWPGHQQLDCQLLAWLSDDGGPVSEHLRAEARHWLQQAFGAATLGTSLPAHYAFVRTLPVGSGVIALVALPDGRLASGSDNQTIRLWDPHTGACKRFKSATVVRIELCISNLSSSAECELLDSCL